MAEKEFLVNIDMNGQEIVNVRIENVAEVPSATPAGRVIFLTTDSTYRIADGTVYKVIATTEDLTTALAGYIPTTEKGTADGVATLGSSGTIPLSQLLTGNVADAVVVLDSPLTEGQVLQWDGTGFVGHSLASAYVPRGSVENYSDLPSLEDATIGDVYNVENEFVIEGHTYPAGTNVACVLDSESVKVWDPLGGFIDLSGYQLIALVTDFTDPSDSTYPSTLAVYTAINTARTELQTAIDAKLDAPTTPMTAGTYTKVTVDANGLVTEGTTLIASDIPDLSETYVRQTQIGVGNDRIPSVNGTGLAGQVIAVNETGDGYVFATIATNDYTGSSHDIVGDGETVSFTFEHGLGRVPKHIDVVDADGYEVGVSTKRDATNITVDINVPLDVGTTLTVYFSG